MNFVREALVSIHFFHKIPPKENKYLILLFFLISILVLSPFFQDTQQARFYFSFLITLVLGVGLYADLEIKRLDYIECGLGILALGLTWIDYFVPEKAYIDFVTQVVYALFFLYFTIELISKIVISNEVSPNLIYAAIVGFLMLGLCGASCASLLQWTVKEAYQLPHNVSFHKFENYIYYSFVTITTVGYGDMIPIHPSSKMLAIVLCVSGHLYTTIVLAIIIGKFLSKQSNVK
jgi:voltage-gated potassium channel